ncbi:DivIVA domain-containing protein [Bifidobacterium sp. 82T10]|uniref:DivIVA domain-containing protein n=1 Tax=Bifidobacterium miconis TaxID=2834435 RepID=A0ABS6WCG9_9BIFI|nr:DivIVA domain-containing protein [Bifidobacterium miconis]MBW3091740.1 DivIVA domain-containing protein [Bifidobacterium miconis]
MAQEPDAGRGGALIARAGKRKLGYDTGQVDAFLDRAHALYDSDESALTQRDIQNVSFDMAKDGYDIAQVDAALSRLERAVVDRQTATQIADQGRVAWRAQTEDLYRQIANHVSRAHRARFQDGQKKTPSYDRKQVDRLIDNIVDKVAAELAVDGARRQDVDKFKNVTSASVSSAIFTQRKGKAGYDERQVDYFLNACVQLLSRLESFARVADLDRDDVAAPSAARSAQGVSPLIPSPDAPRPSTGATDDAAKTEAESFDALHKAEQAIFAPAPASPVIPAAASAAPATTTAATVVPPAPEPAAAPAPAPAVPAAPVHVAQPVSEPAAPIPSPVTPVVSAAHDAHDATAEPAPALAVPATSSVEPEAAETPAPAPAEPSSAPAGSSLAQLAHIVEVSQERAAQSAPTAFRPSVPSLDLPSVPDVHVMAAAASAVSASAEHEPVAAESPAAPAAPATSPATASSTRPAAQPPVVQPAVVQPGGKPKQHNDTNLHTLFPQIEENIDVEIPDLSFPSLYGDDQPKKKAQ